MVRMSSLGDIIMTLPCLSVLRSSYPSAHISWLVNQSYAPLLQENPLLNEVIPFDRKHYSNPLNCLGIRGVMRNLRNQKFDLAIDFQGLFKSAFFAYATRAPVRVGSNENREWSAMFYTHRVNIRREEYHGVDWQLQFLKDIPSIQLPQEIPVNFSFPDFTFAQDSLASKLRKAGLKEKQSYVTIAPGARWITKEWLPERFAELIDRIAKERNLPSVLIGGNEDFDKGGFITSSAKTKPINMIGKTSLPELALLLKQAKVLVTNDTGPMHLAYALGTPVIAIHGPTNPKLTGPYGIQYNVIKMDVPCGPCFKKKCPGYGLVCMTNITIDMVYSKVLNYL